MSITTERILNVGEDAAVEPIFSPQPAQVLRATDPVISPNYSSPGDFAGQYPTPLDPTEFLAMCEEVSLIQNIPEVRTSLKQHTWREMTSLGFNSGSNYLFFADGYCPEEYEHDGSNTTITLKNLGAKKSLGISDIMHSAAVAGANWNGINTIVGGFPAGEGMPGGDGASFQKTFVADLKEKEVQLAAALVLNAWDRMLVVGDVNTSALQFSGIENWASDNSCTMHTRATADIEASGTFSAITFDRFLAESCAKPTHIFGHPTAIQEMLSAYFQLAYQGSQVVNFADGGRITPGFNFAGFVNTGVGRLPVIADNNFTRAAAGASTFSADLWALRMTHNGEPLVYRITQIPFGLRDLVPGCTAISFEIWTKTALIIKMCCAQSQYKSVFTGRIATTCTAVV
jgi:hypothetical protein